MRFLPPPNTRTFLFILVFLNLLLVAVFVAGDALAPAGRRLAKITGDDPPMYFDASHALLFRQSFDVVQEFRVFKPENTFWAPVSKVTGHQTSPSPIGYPLMAMPFLATGTALDALTGNPPDGYSRFAVLFYCLTNVVLTGIGIIALFWLLCQAIDSWKGASEINAGAPAFFVVCAIFCGTTVGYYAFSHMSHAATFASGSLFLAWWWRVRDRADLRSYVILGLFAGLLSISRWQDILFVGAPLLFDLTAGWSEIVRRLRSRLVYGFVIALCWVPQVLQWKFMFGKYLTVPQGSIFVFPPPFIPQMLFSSEHGWFIWTPLALLGVGGLIAASFRAPRVFLPWIVVIALEVSVISAIPVAWNSGPAFGNRYMTSSAPALSLGLAYLLLTAARRTRIALGATIAVLCVYSALFAVQFRMDLIPKLDRLTAAELFTDKLRMPEVRRRKLAALQAEELISKGLPDRAIGILRTVDTVPDRDVLEALLRAYRATGKDAEVTEAEARLRRVLDSRLF